MLIFDKTRNIKFRFLQFILFWCRNWFSSGGLFLLWQFCLTVKSVVVPVSLSFHSMFVEEDSSSLANSLLIDSFKNCSVWLESPAIPGGMSIFENSLMHPVVWEDHSSKTLWLVEFIQSTSIGEPFTLDSLHLYFLGEEILNDFIFNCVKITVLTILCRKFPCKKYHILWVGDFLFNYIKETLERWFSPVLWVFDKVIDFDIRLGIPKFLWYCWSWFVKHGWLRTKAIVLELINQVLSNFILNQLGDLAKGWSLLVFLLLKGYSLVGNFILDFSEDVLLKIVHV